MYSPYSHKALSLSQTYLVNHISAQLFNESQLESSDLMIKVNAYYKFCHYFYNSFS